MAKGYTLTFDYVLYKMSYANLILYSSVLPGYDDDKKAEEEEIINADDPKNVKKVREALYS